MCRDLKLTINIKNRILSLSKEIAMQKDNDKECIKEVFFKDRENCTALVDQDQLGLFPVGLNH